MSGAEQRGLPYLFRLRLTGNVKKPIEKTFSKGDWTNAGQGRQGREDTPRLEGWSCRRSVVILRRRLKEGIAAAGRDNGGQLAPGFVEIGPDAEAHEYGVLVTSLDEEVPSLKTFVTLSLAPSFRSWFIRALAGGQLDYLPEQQRTLLHKVLERGWSEDEAQQDALRPAILAAAAHY